jgi:hypothetical protein
MPIAFFIAFYLFNTGCAATNPSEPTRLPSNLALGGARHAPPKVIPRKRAPLPTTFFLVRILNHDGTQPVDDRLVKTYEIRFQYPEFPNPDLAPLNQAIAGFVSSQRQRMMDWGGFLDETALASGSLPWQSQLGMQVIHSQDSFISLLFQTYEYTGGANGITSLVSFNYDVKSQALLSLHDCFSSQDSVTALTTMIRQQLKQLGLDQTHPALVNQITGEDWADIQCFGLTPNHLVVFFQNDQNVDNSARIEKVEIPWADLKAWISTERNDFWERLMTSDKSSSLREP